MPEHRFRALCMRVVPTLLLWVAAAGIAPGPRAQGADAKVPELRLSTALAPSYPLGRAGERWAQLVNDKAGGRFQVRQYPGATLAQRDPARELDALKDGLADLAVGAALTWSGQIPPLAVYSTPWLAVLPRAQEALAGDAALRERVFALMEAGGVVGLAIAPLGERVLATTKAPVATPAALDRLRVRVAPVQLVIDFYLTLGALPQSLSFALAQSALAAGNLDGQDALPTALVGTQASASGHKFVTRWGALSDVMVFAVRKPVWDAWPDERRALVRAAALQAAREVNALASEEAALAQLTKEGVTIVRLSSAQRAALRDAAQPAIAAWSRAVGDELAGMADAAVASAGK